MKRLSFVSKFAIKKPIGEFAPKARAELLPRWILPSHTGQHWPSGWMVREQVRTGQMTGSQITVRFYGRGGKKSRN